jgi:hypothetical protein
MIVVVRYNKIALPYYNSFAFRIYPILDGKVSLLREIHLVSGSQAHIPLDISIQMRVVLIRTFHQETIPDVDNNIFTHVNKVKPYH